MDTYITAGFSYKDKLYIARNDNTFWEYSEDEQGNQIWKQIKLPPQMIKDN